MTRKIYLNVVSKVILTVEDNVSIDDVISELELVSGNDTLIEDFQVESFTITDSK